MIYKILKTVFREKQYEIICDIFEDNGQLIIGNAVYSIGKKKLNENELDIFFDENVFPYINTEPIEQVKFYTADEVTKILIEKKYIETDEKFSEDMPVSTAITPGVK